MAGRKYSDIHKEAVVELYRRVGLNAAARESGVDKTTVLRWARERDVEPQRVADEVSDRNRRAAAAAAARRTRDAQEARERITKRLAKVGEAGLVRELEVLAGGGFDREDLQALTNARMKAIQQFELLEGRATSRSDGLENEHLLGLVVEAINRAMIMIPEAAREAFTAVFATELRELRDELRGGELPALAAGEVEDAEFVETAD